MKILTISLLSVCLIVVLATLGEAVREDELALYLSFDEGKGDTAKDKSKHGNDATIHKGERVKGKYGNSVELSGEAGGWIEVPDSPSLDITDEITLMCWVYPTEFTAEWFRIIVKTWAGDTAPWMVYGFYEFGGNNGKTGFIISVDKGTEKRIGDAATSNLPPEEWTHVTATYDGSRMVLYYDGEVEVDGNAKGKIDTNDVPVSIGRNSEGNREHYIGRVDEVAIWSVALDQDEVQQAMDRVYDVEPDGKLPTRWGAMKDTYFREPKSFTPRERWQ
ncbi:MAG: LamG domain-containing protein [Candidatus Poribacteria bacterium]|nr:LamG domain-containing protein [Candidatus Poribacteria bacterium]